MKSILRIISGVLVGVVVFIGVAFILGFLFRHFHVSFAKADYAGRCIDNVIQIGFGLLMIFMIPPQIRRKLASGQLSEEKAGKAKKALKLVLPLGILIVGYGVLRIVGVL